jgi:uroporphyrinogen-III decarboxylase
MLDGRPVDRLPLMPITMMFAAAQIGAKYGTYAMDHRVMAEAQIRTAEAFDFDHVSGITETREALDCGAKVRYFEDQPYAIDEQHARLRDKSDLLRMQSPDPLQPGHMQDRILGLARMKQRVGQEKLVEGWVEGPCGAASDLRGINTLMLDLHDDPGFVRDLFEFVVDLAIRFGRAQAEAGAELIGVGDPAASLVGPAIYHEFILPFEKKLSKVCTRRGRASACTFAATRGGSCPTSPSSVAISSTWIRRSRWRWHGRSSDQHPCCSAISIRCATCGMVRPRM